MKVIIDTHYWFEEDDYKFVLKQFKDKKIKIKDFCEKYKFSKTHLYYVLHGKNEISNFMVRAFIMEDIVLPFRF